MTSDHQMQVCGLSAVESALECYEGYVGFENHGSIFEVFLLLWHRRT